MSGTYPWTKTKDEMLASLWVDCLDWHSHVGHICLLGKIAVHIFSQNKLNLFQEYNDTTIATKILLWGSVIMVERHGRHVTSATRISKCRRAPGSSSQCGSGSVLPHWRYTSLHRHRWWSLQTPQPQQWKILIKSNIWRPWVQTVSFLNSEHFLWNLKASLFLLIAPDFFFSVINI